MEIHVISNAALSPFVCRVTGPSSFTEIIPINWERSVEVGDGSDIAYESCSSTGAGVDSIRH